jgi:hypothetical protein
MIYIARDHKGEILGIVSAEDIRAANAYWQGSGETPHTVDSFDLSQDRENENSGYVTPILKTVEIDVHKVAFETKPGKKVRIQTK